MRTVILSAGHSNTKGRDMGAEGCGYIEGVLTANLRKKVDTYLKNKYGIKAVLDSDNSILKESINFFNRLTNPNAIVFEIHFNAFSATSTGTETLIPDDYNSFELKVAGGISKAIGKVMDIVLRGSTKNVAGVKTESDSKRSKLGWMRIVGNNILSEVCFISNPTEMKKYIDNEYKIAEAIADELALASVDYDKSKLSVLNTNPTQTLSGDVIHVVVSGDTLSKLAIKYETSVLAIMKLNNKSDTIIRIGEKLKIK